MVTIAQCQRLETAWSAALATATGGRTFSTHGNTWVWLPARRELGLMFPSAVSAAAVRPALAEGVRLGAASVRVWLNGAVDAVELRDLRFEPSWQPWWMAAPVSAVAGDTGVAQEGDDDGGDAGPARLTDEVPDYTGPLAQELRVVRSQPRQAWHAVSRSADTGNITGAAYSFYPSGVAGLRGLGGIQHLEVLPDHQRQGLATSLVATTARRAAAAGARDLAVNATPQGYQFFSRRGFTLLGRGKTFSLQLDGSARP
ncbi:GNAT family N-acetyltransferase [Arthrobacter bussei]|uniref:GNAT family N-acetyltransferase n=1 Tax=Arthrobacter bussei TaxID=2594179 RepID=A0A7X1NQ85_9MICC|nr:GNAT family N-acetyltransferase [Arthrobacter bussei]MPY11011.1 GNAT family N-acetyltransferase [Arthrobacter bussei]